MHITILPNYQAPHYKVDFSMRMYGSWLPKVQIGIHKYKAPHYKAPCLDGPHFYY